MRILLLDENDHIIGTLELQNGKPVATGLAREIPDLYVVEPGHPEIVLTPADGERWLHAARWLYRDPYVRAVIEGEYIPHPRGKAP